MVIMARRCAETALLILTADSCCVPVLLAFKALREAAISMVKLALFELALKEQSLINERVGLRWRGHIHNQACYHFVELDGFLGPLRVQNLDPPLEMSILSHELLYCFLLLGAI